MLTVEKKKIRKKKKNIIPASGSSLGGNPLLINEVKSEWPGCLKSIERQNVAQITTLSSTGIQKIITEHVMISRNSIPTPMACDLTSNSS